MRVFSGIKPTNQLHIGNYLGAIRQWIGLQKQNECLFCIVDLHALTVVYDPKKMPSRIIEVASAYLAAGIDPKKSFIFIQSSIKEHTELAWLLSTVTPLGDLQRMTQFKDKSKKHLKNINAGLLNYPVLMAADILLYQTDIVPVGIDQKQHVELTREIARKFSAKFGQVFTMPQAMVAKSGAKIMSLAEPLKKMSKSDAENTFISLFDSKEQIKKKISSSTTDSGKEIKYDEKNKPGISNLLTIYSLFADKDIKEIEKEFKDKGYQEFKQALADLLIEKLKPFRETKEEFAKNPEKLEKILAQGTQKAQVIATQTMQSVKKSMGLKTIDCL